jgi:2-oxoglutarate ferredoxin oxidoreductase subunit alpha
MTVKDIISQFDVPPKQRKYVAHMVWVGILAHLLGIELIALEVALRHHFRGNTSKITLNWQVIQTAMQWARTNLTKTDPYRVERMQITKNLILIDGNTAAALGAIYGGVTLLSWYPITPATSLAEALSTYLPRLRRDSLTQENSYAIIQAEDEMAAIGMVLGAGWAGARAMTCTSGPGISLMAELAGYGYYAEIPAVIWDVQRMGPSTGLPTRVSQGDLLSTYFLGHGDTKHICLLPGNILECFDFGWRAFDIAERLQTPVFVLSDLDLGMNTWMSTPFKYPTTELDRGKVLTAEDVDKVGFARYEDNDGDGIAYRTLPGTEHPRAAYFTRGSGHDVYARLSERPEDWENNMSRLKHKWTTAQQYLPLPVITGNYETGLGIIAFGSTDPAIIEAADVLAASGIAINYLRLRALPFLDPVRDFIQVHRRVYIIELNSDAQLFQLLKMAYPSLGDRLITLPHNNGLPLTAAWVVENIITYEGEDT